MPSVPSSGTIGMQTIADSLPFGILGNYSLKQMNIITGASCAWDPDGNLYPFEPYKISNFYGWPGGGFTLGNVQIMQDYALKGYYSGPTSVIADSSGYNRNGTFVQGAGNGTPIDVTGYNSSIGYINTSNTNQYSVKLDNFAKFDGTTSNTIITWFKVDDLPTNNPGLIACEGRATSNNNPIGYSLYLSKLSATTFVVSYTRWNGTVGNNVTLNLDAQGFIFTTGVWYMVALIYNGTIARLIVYRTDNVKSEAAGTNTNSITTQTNFSCFQGLRYNEWLNGSFGYTAFYNFALSSLDVYRIQQITRLRYI